MVVVRQRLLDELLDLHPGPVSGDQWADGRSAKELARAWLEGDALTQTTALLTARPEFEGLRLERGLAEKETRFDEIRGGPRSS